MDTDIKTDDYTLLLGDCLERMKEIPTGTVDMILTDLPYGITVCEWDKVIPFDLMWEQYLRVAKENAAIVLFSQMPFGADLICSNRSLFRYEWIYEKSNRVGFLQAKKAPLRIHENILVFYRSLPTYNPQYTYDKPYNSYRKKSYGRTKDTVYGNVNIGIILDNNDGERYPVDIVRFVNNGNNQYSRSHNGKHPTQKPVALCEYMVRTYTNKNELVLDSCMGSGTTGVACINTKRKFIGIELEKEYFDTATQRIAQAKTDIGNREAPMIQTQLF